MSALKREFDFFISHQEQLAREYNGKYVVIHEQEVVGAYDSALEATSAARQRFKMGDFLVQHAQLGSDAFTQSYYSRAAV